MSKVNKLFPLIQIVWERQRKDKIPGRLFWQFECEARQHMLGLPLTDEPRKGLLIFSMGLKKIRKNIGCVIVLPATITEGFSSKEYIGVLCSTAGELNINVMDLKFLYVISLYRLQQELWNMLQLYIKSWMQNHLISAQVYVLSLLKIKTGKWSCTYKSVQYNMLYKSKCFLDVLSCLLFLCLRFTWISRYSAVEW